MANSQAAVISGDHQTASASETPFVPDQSDSDSDVSMDEDGSSSGSSQAGASNRELSEHHEHQAQQTSELGTAKIAADESHSALNSTDPIETSDSVGDQQAVSVSEPKADEPSRSKADNMTTNPESGTHSDGNVDDTAPMELESGHSSPVAIDTPLDQSATDEESAEEEVPTSPSDQMASATQLHDRTQGRGNGALHEVPLFLL